MLNSYKFRCFPDCPRAQPLLLRDVCAQHPAVHELESAASLNGVAFQFLWPRATTWNDEAIILTLSGTVLFGSLFSIRFLNLRQHLPRVVPILQGLIAVSVLLMPAAFLLTYDVLIRMAIAAGAFACLGGLMASALRWRQGDATARLYTIAWSLTAC